MARISGVDIPNGKRVEIALTYIYGIGLKSSKDILAKTGINPDTRAKDLTEEDIATAGRIAKELNLSEKTVLNYITALYDKTGTKNRVQFLEKMGRI